MEELLKAAEHISLFCRLNINTKRELPIRSSEMGMLIYLCKTDGDKTPMGISRFFKVSKAMATNMVTAMHKKGYITKQPSQEDRRSNRIIPTPKAMELVENAYDEYYKTMLTLSEKMGSKNFAALIDLLDQANTILLEEKNNG